jgi:predicted nucleotidyltransferase
MLGSHDGRRGAQTDGVEGVEALRAAVLAHPGVTDVSLVGSRARGDDHELSDWDFKVRTIDFGQVAEDLPGLVAGLSPLGALWDPLSSEACFMVIVEGPTKIDFIFDQPNHDSPPWTVSSETLGAIDVHFWDWILWLSAKQYAGKRDVIRTHLVRMFEHLLGPLGMAKVPISLKEAVASYQVLRSRREAEFSVNVSGRLGDQVAGVVRSLP